MLPFDSSLNSGSLPMPTAISRPRNGVSSSSARRSCPCKLAGADRLRELVKAALAIGGRPPDKVADFAASSVSARDALLAVTILVRRKLQFAVQFGDRLEAGTRALGDAVDLAKGLS
jgi:hypothetical protein